MSRIRNVYIMPHAPILIPKIGGSRGLEAKKTIDACIEISRRIMDDGVNTLILSSPHAPCLYDTLVVNMDEELKGDFAMFGHSEISLSFSNKTEITEKIIEYAEEKDISVEERRHLPLDHGALVPLHFINEEYKRNGKSLDLVHLSTPFLSNAKLYELGKFIDKACSLTSEKTAYLASGDMSHMLTRDAPAGYSPKGRVYDLRLVEIIKEADTKGLLSITENEMHEAGECGTRSFIMGFGTLDGKSISSQVLSYEGPFGVGYMCAQITPDIIGEDVYVDLAKFTIEKYVREHKRVAPADFFKEKGLDEPQEFGRRAGVFVSLKKYGELRGCIGTISPTCENVLEEIVQNAISASAKDPRFDPVSPEELDSISYSVDVLGEAEEISSLDELDIKRYGVIVSKGFRKGLLLPDLEGVDTVEEQVRIALLKAGISPQEDYSMQRFEVVRYHEKH